MKSRKNTMKWQNKALYPICMNEDVSSSLQTLTFLKYLWFGGDWSGSDTGQVLVIRTELRQRKDLRVSLH